jgi:hypothetical protein
MNSYGRCGSCYSHNVPKVIVKRIIQPIIINNTTPAPAPAPAPAPTPAPSGTPTPAPPTVINVTVTNITETTTNCSFYKVCRQRAFCSSDQEWWNYWTNDGIYGYGGCNTYDGCFKKKHQQVQVRKRVCNASEDSSFDVNEF